MPITVEPLHNRDEWNEFITRYGQWSLFQSYDWGLVQEASGSKVMRLGIFNDNNLAGIAQIVEVSARRGRFFHIRHGPVFIPTLDSDLTEKLWQTFLAHTYTEAKKAGAVFIRLNPMLPETSELQQLFIRLKLKPAPIHAMDAEICWVLSLETSTEELLKGMRKTTRYLVRQAEKIGVTVSESSDIDRFMKLYKDTAQRHGFVEHQSVAEEFRVFGKSGNATLFLASYQDVVYAGALILFFENQAIYHHGASISNKIPASYFLQWKAIQYAKEHGKKLYNFWGIAPSESSRHPWRGLTLFKQGFGGHEQHFVHAQDLPVSAGYIIPYTIETIRRLRRGYA